VPGLHVALWAAFAAGLLSVVSPCVLPLVPVYAAYLAGDAAPKGRPWRTFGRGLLFVLGFSVVFVALGATATELGRILSSHAILLEKVAGGLIVAFGLVLVGAVPLRALLRTVRIDARPGSGPLGSFVLGLAFAAGWTPCVGPILTSILLLAATVHTAGEGAMLLAVYALGLAVPFLALAALAGPLTARIRAWSPYLAWSERAAGVLLMAMGAAMAMGLFGRLASL
jgi:cytochrome c-type biogenesis protein